MNKYIKLERDELFPALIKDLGLKIGIEIGVREGYHSLHLLQKTKIKLYGIDIKYDPRVEEAKSYNERYTYILKSSEESHILFDNNFFDFIYIDANHTAEEVYKDLIMWWPKLKTGGIFAGDDYLDLLNPAEGRYGVPYAVETFSKEISKDVFISGKGYIPVKDRLEYAKTLGKKHEDNLFLKFHKYIPLPESYIRGRVITENIPIPQWIIYKNDSEHTYVSNLNFKIPVETTTDKIIYNEEKWWRKE